MEGARALICAEIAGLATEFDSNLKAIVLTGSTARREQTSLQNGDTVRLLSDVEGFFVFSDSEFPRQQERVKDLARKLEGKLQQQKIVCSLDINAVPERFLLSLRPNIFSYELAMHGDVIWGDRNILSSIPKFAVADIPLEDAWRLLARFCKRSAGARRGRPGGVAALFRAMDGRRRRLGGRQQLVGHRSG